MAPAKKGSDKEASEEAAKPSAVTAEAELPRHHPDRTDKDQEAAVKAAAADGVDAKMDRLKFPDQDSEDAKRELEEQKAGIAE